MKSKILLIEAERERADSMTSQLRSSSLKNPLMMEGKVREDSDDMYMRRERSTFLSEA